MSAPSGGKGGAYLRGIEMPLPAGERVLWQGAPGRAALARHAFHVRKIAIYFVLLLVLAAVMSGATSWHALLGSAIPLGVSAVVACAFALLLATLTTRTTVYAITERRVVLRVGIALPVVVNVPLHVIESVDFRRRADGGGDIALRLGGGVRVAYLVLWPHARAWRLRHPEPLLRGLADVDAVGAILRSALLAQIAQADSTETPPVAIPAGAVTGVTAPGAVAGSVSQSEVAA